MATNGRVRGNATRATVPYLLKGLVFGNDGRALSPFHTTKKNGRRYCDDVPQRETLRTSGHFARASPERKMARRA